MSTDPEMRRKLPVSKLREWDLNDCHWEKNYEIPKHDFFKLAFRLNLNILLSQPSTGLLF